MHKNQKLCADKEAHKNVESDLDDNELYQIGNMSVENTK